MTASRFSIKRCILLAATSTALLWQLPATSVAADAPWPTRPIHLVVGYSAGGATDIIARLVASRLSEQLGQAVIVDNRAGANSNIGAELVARAPADGYLLYVYTIANTINATLYDKLNYDPLKDFQPIGLIAKVPNILVVNATLPINSVKDYVKFAGQSPDGITFASSGTGSSIHLSGEMFKMVSKAKMTHVPYRGSAPAVTDLLGGHVQAMFDNAPSALPNVRAGKLRAIAVTSAQRSPLLPDVPTIAESGYPGFDVQSWFGLSGPAGTPKPIVDRLNRELGILLAKPDVRKVLIDLGATPDPDTPTEYRAFIAAEIAKWHDVVKAAGVTAE